LQRYLPGRTPEITDVLLALLAALTIFVIQRRYPRLVLGVPAVSVPAHDPAVPSMRVARSE
jgi:hypothetical protein